MADQITNNEEYWRAMSQHGNPIYRNAGIQNLQRIQHQKDMAGRAAQFQASLGQREADSSARRAATESAHRDQVRLAEQREKGLGVEREAKRADTQEAMRNRQSAGWLNLAQSPEIDTIYAKDPAKAAAIKKYALNQYLQSLQPGGGGQPTTGGTAGLDAIGGQAVDPRAAAVRNQHQAAGRPVVPQTAPSPTNAPAGTPQQAGGGQPQAGGGGGGWFSPSRLSEGSPTSERLQQMLMSGDPKDFINASRALGRPYTEGGIIYNPDANMQAAMAAGQHYNLSTGEWNSNPSLIDNKPAALALAEGGIKIGRPPQDNEARALYEQMKNAPAGPGLSNEGSPSRDAFINKPMTGSPSDLVGPNVQQGTGAQGVPADTGHPADFQAAGIPESARSPWSLVPALGTTIGGAMDRTLGIGGGAPAPGTPLPANAAPAGDPWGFGVAQRPVKPIIPPEEVENRKKDEE